MRRLFVLCVIFLSILSFPGNASAIFGEVWNIGALSSAANPAMGPPKVIIDDKEVEDLPDATFEVKSINFNSQAQNVSFNEFLNSPEWTYIGSGFESENKMFKNNGSGNGYEGIFFRFTWELYLYPGTLPVTITHDDGFFLLFATGEKVDQYTEKVGSPTDTTFNLTVPSEGKFRFILNYGALNDTDSQVLIFRTPEPGSLLLLALGIIGIGVLRRRN